MIAKLFISPIGFLVDKCGASKLPIQNEMTEFVCDSETLAWADTRRVGIPSEYSRNHCSGAVAHEISVRHIVAISVCALDANSQLSRDG